MERKFVLILMDRPKLFLEWKILFGAKEIKMSFPHNILCFFTVLGKSETFESKLPFFDVNR